MSIVSYRYEYEYEYEYRIVSYHISERTPR